MDHLKKYFPILILLLLSFAAFYQISLNIQPVKWDAIDCFYPWRYFIGECLKNGQLPYWNPYQDLGYPIHADPSSGAWYPVVWLIGGTIGYTVYTIGFEFLMHVFLAGVGMYMLAKELKMRPYFALMAAVAFMLSGFFVGNAQHLSYVISACWLPFIVQNYLLLMKEKKAIHSLKAALFMFLSITGGYPAITIILSYLLLVFFLTHLVTLFRSKAFKSIRYFVFQNALFLLATLLFSAAMILSIVQVSPYLSRLGNFNLEQALYSPLSPQSFISFLAPLTTTTQSTFWDSDLSMRNGYFSLILFLFFLLGAFSKKPNNLRILFWFGLFSLTAAVGDYLPVREWLYKYVPLMNLFRFPSVFRLFFIFGGLLTGVFYLQNLLNDHERKKWPAVMLIILAFFVFIILLFVGRSKGYLSLSSYFQNDLFNETLSATYWQNLAVNGLVQIAFLVILVILIWKIKSTKRLTISILCLLMMDALISVQMLAPYTVFYEHVTAKEAAKNVGRYPHGFPAQKWITIDSSARLPGIGQPFWQNQQIFQKQISAEGFNSFSFSNYEMLERDFPVLFKSVKQSHLVTLSDTLIQNAQEDSIPKGSVFVYFGSYKSPGKYQVSKGDTVQLKKYDAARFDILANVEKQCLLTLFQKQYTGWHATVNGKSTPIFLSNLNFMTIELPAGESRVSFTYRNPSLNAAVWISIVSILAALTFIFFDQFRQKKQFN